MQFPPRTFYSNVSFMLLKGTDSLKYIQMLRTNISTSPLQTTSTGFVDRLTPFSPFENRLRASGWDGLTH